MGLVRVVLRTHTARCHPVPSPSSILLQSVAVHENGKKHKEMVEAKLKAVSYAACRCGAWCDDGRF